MQIRLTSALEFSEAELREISVSGGLVAGAVQPPVGANVVLRSFRRAARPLRSVGPRRHHAGPNQTGVRFLYREGAARGVRELVRRFKAL